jgi:porphobilinogen synthase
MAIRSFTPRFPANRLRRLRSSAAMRTLVAGVRLSPADLIWPLFVMEGIDVEQPIATMPGISRLSIDRVVKAAALARDLGIPAICLFPYIDPSLKTEDCAMAWDANNLINRCIRALKTAVPEIAIMTDVALDPYNINGHDGFVRNGVIMNDLTLSALAKMALAQAQAGADIIGPSDMMDGRVGAIRQALESGGFPNVTILSYAAKYASAFYGPFRDAVGASSALKGDKKTYQMDPANGDEALLCVARDLAEGADMVMVKPGLAYLDICYRVKSSFGVPTFAYQVSGEYAAIMFAAAAGALNEEAVMMESLLAFKRAGCDGILTYFAPQAAALLGKTL